jgi:hypothetical protein
MPPIVVSITSIRRNKSFFELQSHFSFPFLISFLIFEICLIGISSNLVFNLLLLFIIIFFL